MRADHHIPRKIQGWSVAVISEAFLFVIISWPPLVEGITPQISGKYAGAAVEA